MIVVFVVDTSVSMNQQTAAGNMSVLDCAKALIEHFLKVRGRTQPLLMRQDRYFRTYFLKKRFLFFCFYLFIYLFFVVKSLRRRILLMRSRQRGAIRLAHLSPS
jgi:hypothetical protein